MPQLDKVTLFSQVFWLIFLYFFFFLIFLKHYLPKFSKLFKIRSYYLGIKNLDKLSSYNAWLGDFSEFSSIVVKFHGALKENLKIILNYYNTVINYYNFSFLKKINILFIAVYISNSLKFNLYKKLYF